MFVCLFADDGVGDACTGDFDADGVPDSVDNCPQNAKIFNTDFTDYIPVLLDPRGTEQVDPQWKILDNVSIFMNIPTSPYRVTIKN